MSPGPLPLISVVRVQCSVQHTADVESRCVGRTGLGGVQRAEGECKEDDWAEGHLVQESYEFYLRRKEKKSGKGRKRCKTSVLRIWREGKGKAVSLPRTREFELSRCPTEMVSARLPPAVPWVAFQNCVN